MRLVKMISLRKCTVNSTSGHATSFEASDPRKGILKPALVHPNAVPEALKMGCVPFEDDDVSQVDDDSKLRAGFGENIRKSLLLLVMDRMRKENQAKNFDAGGVPKTDILSKIVLFDVDPKERVEVWRHLMNVLNTGEDLQIDEDARKVLDVLDAEGKAELILLCNERGIPEAEYHGLTARDMRKKLLSQFAGLPG